MQARNAIHNPQLELIDNTKQSNYQWIMHPVIDLLLVCGGMLWLAALLMATGLLPSLSDPKSAIVTNMALAAFVFFVLPHQLATYLRVYDIKTTREAAGTQVALLGVVCLTLGVIACLSPFWASLVGRLTFAFSFQHFYAQAYGIALIYCYKRGYIFTPSEKKLFSALIQSGVWLGIARLGINLEPSLGPVKLIRYWPPLPNWVMSGLEILSFTLAAVFGLIILRKWQATKKWFPLPAFLTILTAFFLFAYLPSVPNIGGSLLVLYMIGHSFFHTPQYLVVTSAYHIKDRGMPKGIPYSKIFTQLWKPTAFKYFVFLYSTAMLIALGVSWLLPKIHTAFPGVTVEYIFFAYLAVFNLHHYWVDALVWRMKDKKTLGLLIA